MLIDAMASLRVTVRDTLEAEGRVGYEWHLTATHAAELLGVPASGRPVDIRGATVFDLDVEGLIVSERRYWDSGALLRQIGSVA
jgi:steroid delta-isomerase-like uncharacterized protein